MPQYEPVREEEETEPCYGVRATEGSCVLKYIPAVFDNEKDALKLTALLNEEAVSLCHFEDIIEDYLTDFTV